MLAMIRVVSLAFLATLFAETPISAQSIDPRPVAGSISGDLTIDEAMVVLQNNGYSKPFGLAWAKPARDHSFRAFQIDEGVVLVIVFSDTDKSIISLRMLFTPPVLAKANDRVLDLRKITFEPDGTYLLHILKQEKQVTERATSPVPQLPKPSLSK